MDFQRKLLFILAQVIALESAKIIKSRGTRVLDSPRKLLITTCSNYCGSDVFPNGDLPFFITTANDLLVYLTMLVRILMSGCRP